MSKGGWLRAEGAADVGRADEVSSVAEAFKSSFFFFF